MPRLKRKLFFEWLFIILLGLPFIPWINPFHYLSVNMHILYGSSGFNPLIERWNHLFETMTRPIVSMILFGRSPEDGYEQLFIIVRSMFIYIIAVNIIGMTLIFLLDRVVAWKLPLATFAWIVIPIFMMQATLAQTNTILNIRAAMNTQRGKSIELAVQQCKLHDENTSEQEIVCSLVVSDLPSEALSDRSERPLISVFYSHPQMGKRNNIPGSYTEYYRLTTNDTLTFSPDSTTVSLESRLVVNDSTLRIEDFYISSIEYHVGFNTYTSKPMHIMLKDSFQKS